MSALRGMLILFFCNSGPSPSSLAMSVIREEMMLGGRAASERELCGAEKPSSSDFAAIAMAMLNNGVVHSRLPGDDFTASLDRN